MKHIITTFLFCTISTLTTAQDSFKKELFPVNMVLKYRTELDMSNETIDRIKKIYNAQTTEFNSLKWDLDAEVVALDTYLSTERVDEDSAITQLGIVMVLENKLKRMKLSMLIQIKNNLSPSQQETLKTLRAENGDKQYELITPINENPRVMLKVDGSKSRDEVLFVVIDKKSTKKFLGSSANDIDPKDIESIEVLKGEKAIEKYGDDGKNGVVIIRMKKR